MQIKKYTAAIIIGRFQPMHIAHLELMRRATAYSDNIIVIVGSSNKPRTYKNPFTFEERSAMIRYSTSAFSSTVTVVPCDDYLYNDQAWAMQIQKICTKYVPDGNGVIIGHKKDSSSFYLDMFPQYDFIDVEKIEPLSAIDIRDLYFRKNVNFNILKGVCPQQTLDFLKRFSTTPEYEQIINERNFIESYKKQYASLTYPPVFVTVDVVVVQSGHLLMIKRRSEPGKGLYALPGGFLDTEHDTSLVNAAIRELREETKIKVPEPVLRGNIVSTHVFDAIERSSRGRTITHAFYIKLPDGELPKVKGSDDAEKAKWIPFSEVNSRECFEDHYEIFRHFVM